MCERGDEPDPPRDRSNTMDNHDATDPRRERADTSSRSSARLTDSCAREDRPHQHTPHEDTTHEHAHNEQTPREQTHTEHTRRHVLAGIAAVGVAGVAGFGLAPSPPSRPTTANATEVASAPYAGATITTESESPIARYQYRPTDDGFESTAPINVVFPLSDSPVALPGVMAVLEEAGWLGPIEEYARYAWDRDAERFVHQEATAAETYLGLHGRLHVRCWAFEGVVSMQAHEDTAARPHHAIASYVDARERIEALFADAGWRITRDRVDLQNGGGGDHDGLASIVLPEVTS